MSLSNTYPFIIMFNIMIITSYKNKIFFGCKLVGVDIFYGGWYIFFMGKIIISYPPDVIDEKKVVNALITQITSIKA